MDNEFIFNLCQYILNEEQSGNALPPEDFNRLMRISSLELARQLFRTYEGDQDVSDALRRFKEDSPLDFDDGVEDLPSDYRKISYLLADGVFVDIVDDYEFGKRQNEYILAPSEDYPIARLVGDTIEILPTTITSATLYYLKEPETPFFDYYYDASGRIVHFPTSDSPYTLETSEVGREGETEGDSITSEDEELDWNDNEKLVIVGMICSKAGANLKEGQIIEYSELMKSQTA